MTDETPDGDMETLLPNLSGSSLHDLCLTTDPDVLAAVDAVLQQVERPRINLGSSGPPGRAD